MQSMEMQTGTATQSTVEAWDLLASEQHNEPYLIAETLGGNNEAFDALVRPRLGLFTHGIHRILQDACDTQDALREALLHIRSELSRFQGRMTFSTWAYRICLNQALSLRRTRWQKRGIVPEELITQFGNDECRADQ